MIILEILVGLILTVTTWLVATLFFCTIFVMDAITMEANSYKSKFANVFLTIRMIVVMILATIVSIYFVWFVEASHLTDSPRVYQALLTKEFYTHP